LDPERRPAIDRIREYADREVAFGQHGRARDVTLEAAAMAEPAPAVGLAHREAEPVIGLETLFDAPLLARHLTAARRRDHAVARVRRKLREEARGIGRGRHEARRRRDRMRGIVAGNDEALAERKATGVSARERRAS